jgi:hypothetical protein
MNTKDENPVLCPGDCHLHGGRGVTLVETAALMAMACVVFLCLIPALGAVEQFGASGECLANLGRIAHANTIYTVTEPSDPALPVHRLQTQQIRNQPTFIGAYEWGGKSGRGRNSFVPEYAGQTLGSKYGTAAGFGPPTRPLNKILFDREFPEYYDWQKRQVTSVPGAESDTELDLPVLRCPTDSGYAGVHFRSFENDGLTSYDHFGTSYTANMLMISTGGEMLSNSPYLHRVSELLAPSSTLAFLENSGRFAWSAGPTPEGCQFTGYIAGQARGWHGQDWTFNASFVDAHAESIYMRSYYNPQIYLDQSSGSYSEYRCIIIRGDNWQMDTLPVPFTPTGLTNPYGGRASWEGDIETDD